MTWTASSFAAKGLVPQHSEDLRPALTRASKSGIATLEFTAFDRGFRLQLTPNPRLAQIATGSSVDVYAGTVEGAPGSWARISIQDGRPRGMIWDGHELFVVDAAPEGVNYGAAGTVMFKLSDAVLERGVSFASDAVETPRDAASAYDRMIGELRARTRGVRVAGVATERVDISVLGDTDFLERYPSESQARDAILVRLNNVDGIFSSQLGVELRVVSVDIGGEHTSSLSETTDSNDLLEELGQLRRQRSALSATGLTHLFTGRELDGDGAGIAYVLGLCSPRYAASLAKTHVSAALDSLITAHEIGHVFGAPHDGEDRCASTPQGEFIMSPTLSTTSIDSFSQCSLDEINAVMDSYSCVVALPASVPPPPAPPAPPSGGGGGGGDGGGGGGGSLDPALLLILLVLLVARSRRYGMPRA
jgi:hypothetical protein